MFFFLRHVYKSYVIILIELRPALFVKPLLSHFTFKCFCPPHQTGKSSYKKCLNNYGWKTLSNHYNMQLITFVFCQNDH